jgi:DNA-directed RNA polymerase subunit F
VAEQDNIARPVTLAEVKNILKNIEKDRKELLYEQKIALEHANKFAKLSEKKAKDLIKELSQMNSIHEIHAYKIADILPKTQDDLKTIFAKERVTLSDNDCKKILEIVAKYSE